jgi:short-subunit dehydrogenase
MTTTPSHRCAPTARVLGLSSSRALGLFPHPPETRRAGTLALVTGASSGIGAQIARGLIRRGYRLILLGLHADPIHQIVDEMDAADRCVVLGADLAETGIIDRMVPRLLQQHGSPAVLINCAGQGIYRPFAQHSIDDHRRLMQINHFAALQLIDLVLPRMIARGSGIVINVSSMASKNGAWGHSAYAASKAALAALTQSLAAEHAGTNVHFCCVYPGIVATPYFHRPETAGLWEIVRSRAIPAAVAAERILSLLDKPRLELHIPRFYRVLDWMRAVAPRLTHALIARESRPRKVQPSRGQVPRPAA